MSAAQPPPEWPRSQPEQLEYASGPSSSSRPSLPSPVDWEHELAQTPGVSEPRPPAPAQRNSSSSARSLPPGAGYANTFTAQPEPPPMASVSGGPRPAPQLPLMSLGGWDADPKPADGKNSMLDTVIEADGGSAQNTSELEELAPPARERAATTPAELSPRNSLPVVPARQRSDPTPQRSSLQAPPKPGGILPVPALTAEPTSSYPYLPTPSPTADDAPSTSQPPNSELFGPRPSLPLPQIVRSNSLASEHSQDYALPLQFPPTATDRVRPSTIPAFVPALAFSANDRGPYPPTSSYPIRSSAQPASTSGPRESFYAGMALVNTGMDGPYPAPAPATSSKGKGRASDEVELNRRASQFYSNQVAGARDDLLAQSQPAQAQPPPERVARVTSPGGAGGEFRDSMVGVGRNSIIRSGGALSPTSQNLLLGPAPGGRNSPPTAAATQFAQQQSPPPHLVQQPEICVECMMRDRDMIDVDVTGDGVWERESDQDFDEAMRWDEESVERGSDESAGQRARRGTGSREPSLAGGSRDSHTGRGSMYGAPPRKKLGKGQPLTTPSLKLWTSMNPPASAHRWRTLQAFLATQIQLLELERHAREATAAERERERHGRPSTDSRQSGPPLLGSIGRNKSASTLLPNGLVVESINVDRDEKQGRARAKSRSRALDERASYHQPAPGATLSPDDNVRMYASGDQPWLAAQPRRFSSPALKDVPGGRPSSATSFKSFGLGKFARSSTDLRSIASPRSISPGRASLGVDDRRGSMWSKFRQSASQSVLSLAPSGSMMDMHLGMSMDKHAQQHAHAPYNHSYPAHAYPSSMSDPAVARHADVERGRVMALAAHARPPSKPKKKGIKGFFSKLIAGTDTNGKQRHGISASEPGTPSVPLGLEHHEGGDYLVPPPPLSALANEPQYHNRSLSNSSVDSIQQPFTPPQSSRGPTPAGGHPYTDFMRPGGMNSLADRGSIMTNGSFSSVRSKPGSTTSPVPGRNSFQRPSIDYLSPEPSPPRHQSTFLPRSSSPEQVDLEREEEILYASVRREKSLPSLPSEAATSTDPAATFPFPLQHTQSNLPYSSLRDTRSAYSIRTPSLSPPRALGGEDWDDDARSDVGGGRKSKARSKVWSMNFGAFAARKKGASARPSTEHDEKGDTVVREAALEGIRREGGLVSHPWFYFDSLHKRYGPLVHLKMLGEHHILVGNAELAQELFARRSATYSSRTNSPYFRKHIAPHGRHWVFEPDNAYWRVARKLTGPLMASVRAGETENLQEMEAKQTVVDLLREPEQWIDHVARFASSSVMSATYGKHCARSDDSAILDIVELNDLIAAGANPAAAPINFLPLLDMLPDRLAPWRTHAAKLRKREDELYFGMLKDASPSPAFWARRLQGSKELAKAPVEGMPKLEPAFLAGQLVNAAAETTFITLKSFVLAMCLYPEGITSAKAQIDQLVGVARPPNFEDRAQLPLVDALVRETFRKWPSLPFGMDHTATADDVVQVNGKDYFVPSGSLLFGTAWTIERDPSKFSEPDKFLPERHLRDDGTLKNDEGTAFGWGRRACPGEPFADRGLWINVALIVWALDVSPFKEPATGLTSPSEGHPWTGEFLSHPAPFRCIINARSPAHEKALLASWEATEKDVEALYADG